MIRFGRRTAFLYSIAVFGAFSFTGCGGEEPPAEVAVETPATDADALREMVDKAVAGDAGSIEGIATVFFESESALREANPGKSKEIEEAGRLLQNARQQPELAQRVLPQIQSRLKQLR